jgi:predicted AlkP superfamily pyrophosphatase or phosphodiesterase
MQSRRPLHVFVLIDALGWRVLEGRQFLNDLLPHRTPLRTVLGFSSGAIPTILTGLPPSETGHWNLFYYDPQGSPFRWLRYFLFLPSALLENRVTRKVLKEMGRRVLGLGPLFECLVATRLLPYFNWVEKRNIYGRKGITGAPSIFDDLEAAAIPHRVYTYHHWRDTEILDNAIRDLKGGEVEALFLYLSEMDHFLHEHRPDPDRLYPQLKRYEDRLREVFELARRQDSDVRIYVFSDHGMTPVGNRYDLMRDVEALGLRMPQDYLVVYDSTMARYWFFSEEARRKVMGVLQASPCGRILPDKELQDLGIFFEDRRFGEVIFLLHPGWLLSRSDFNGAGWNPSGMHGYHPDDPESDAIFLSNRDPGIPMRTLSDVHTCIRKSMNLGASSRQKAGIGVD